MLKVRARQVERSRYEAGKHGYIRAASKTPNKVIAISAPVAITAGEGEGEKKGPAKFVSTFYTGGKLNIEGWDMPVVVDLAGLKPGNVLVANLDHDKTKRVGNFAVANDGRTLVANGTATAKTAARDEVVGSAADGYQWQSSLEVNPGDVKEVKDGKTVAVNGQELEGPFYHIATGTLKGFAFVSHGADDNTTATIAATAASKKGKAMKDSVKAWAVEMGIDVEAATPEQVAVIEANYEGRNGKTPTAITGSTPSERRKIEAKRRTEINDLADQWMEKREGDLDWINGIEEMRDHAIEAKQSVQDFRNDLYESMVPLAHTVQPRTRDKGATDRTIMAAICEYNRLNNLDKHFTDQELQAAHDEFPGGIGPAELLLLSAEARGYRRTGRQVTKEVMEYAFAKTSEGRQIRGGGGFSTINVSTITGAVANKFVMDGWNAVDQTCLRIAKITPVRNFQLITTVSLTDSLRYEQVGNAGEITHGTADQITYTNQANTYAKMLAITRQDIINDDAGAFASVPRKLGNGAIKLLNHIFWTEFLVLVSANFFASGNNNINTAVADMTVGGLDATETIFMNQTNPDGTPLALQPAILLVPSALKNKALNLMGSQLNSAAITSWNAATGDANPFSGRFRVESSPYISSSAFTGNTAQAWWMLANPNELAVIEIVALNGRVEPTVDSAEADFNTLGVQWRGYADVGVKRQEFRAGVHADGGSS